MNTIPDLYVTYTSDSLHNLHASQDIIHVLNLHSIVYEPFHTWSFNSHSSQAVKLIIFVN